MIPVQLIAVHSHKQDVSNDVFILSDSETKHNNLVAKYHPNFWMDGKWRCCQQTEKLAPGCHVYDPVGYGLYCFFSSTYFKYIFI